jgi:predicted dehydrogenase
MTVYGLHTLTGILGPVKRATAMSGIAIREREFQGQAYPTDADDNSMILLDFGDSVFALAHGTVAGGVSEFGQPSIFGTKGTIAGLKLNGEPLDYPGRVEGVSPVELLPHVKDTPHAKMQEAHVFEDLMQLVDLVRDGTPSNATPEHARHVIEIIEAGYRAAETGVTQELKTTFTPPDGVVAADLPLRRRHTEYVRQNLI